MSTRTITYTETDVRKVAEHFAADLLMLARRTGAMTPEEAKRTAHDVIVMAVHECFSSVHVQLISGHDRYAKEYTVLGSGDWEQHRPGGNNWPYKPNGQLYVIVVPTNRQKIAELRRNGSLINDWGTTNLSTDYSNATQDSSREYSSGGYGWSCKTYIG